MYVLEYYWFQLITKFSESFPAPYFQLAGQNHSSPAKMVKMEEVLLKLIREKFWVLTNIIGNNKYAYPIVEHLMGKSQT